YRALGAALKQHHYLLRPFFPARYRVTMPLKVRDPLQEASGGKRQKHGLNSYTTSLCDGYSNFKIYRQSLN
ncbi:hypothetical protein, partial [Citrobacter freundii]|uniref:hypothetical protein n=1 Tax=Citrobacter freundii TaxID=546 RepID=UPI0019D204E9